MLIIGSRNECNEKQKEYDYRASEKSWRRKKMQGLRSFFGKRANETFER